MKVFCSKETLLTGVNTVQRAVSAKATLPILQGIYLKAEGQSLIFTATDLEIGIHCQIPAQVTEEGAAVLPARLFSELVRKLPDTTITLELIDNTLHIHYFQSSLTLKSFDPEEFPLLPDLLDSQSFSLPTSLFKNMVKQTVIACAVEESRPVFTGILLQVEGPQLRLVATDTHRLAYCQAEFPNQEGLSFHGIIPAKTMLEISRLLKEEDEALDISYNNAQISFKFGNVHLLSRLIEGQFPPYNQVIPQSCETKVHLSLRSFLDAVDRASLLSREGGSGITIVRLNIDQDTETLKIEQTSEMGNISEQIEINIEGKGLVISFNSKFLLDALKVIDSEFIVLELSGAYGACVIRPDDDPNYLYLALPVRTA